MSEVDPLEILLECERECLCATDAKASSGGQGADPAESDVSQTDLNQGDLTPKRKTHSIRPLHLLPEATSLFHGSKDMSKHVSLKDIKSLFYQAMFGTKDQNQAYVKIISNT